MGFIRSTKTILGWTIAIINKHNAVAFQSYESRRILRRETAVAAENDVARLSAVTFSGLARHQEPSDFCDYLIELGACSATITDANKGTDSERPLFGDPSVHPIDVSEAWESTRVGIWDSCNVVAHFPASYNLENILLLNDETMREVFFPDCGEDLRFDVSVVEDRDWVVHVQQNWKPLAIDNKFVLVFPWHDDQDVKEAVKPHSPADFLELRLQGGIAFGTGEHATTQLCLSWIYRTVTQLLQTNRPLSVLDYGAGSGILGIAACSLAPSQVVCTGIDVDTGKHIYALHQLALTIEDACRIANANAKENGVHMSTYLPSLQEPCHDDESKSMLLRAQSRVLGTDPEDRTLTAPAEKVVEGSFDICVANILVSLPRQLHALASSTNVPIQAGALVVLAPTLFRLLRSNGLLGLSGVLTSQSVGVQQAYEDAGFVDVSEVRAHETEWVLITAKKP